MLLCGMATAQNETELARTGQPSDASLAAPARSRALGDSWALESINYVTMGVGVRTHEQKAGLAPGGKNNTDDSDLNYRVGDSFSRVAKITSMFKAVHASGIGFSLGGMAWYDHGLLQHDVPHGNNPNNYVPDTPLSDAGFDRAARFQGAQLLNAHLFGTSTLGAGPLAWKIGLVSIEREGGFSFSGGLRDLETRNYAATTRPGAQAEEDAMPIWAATGRWFVNPELRIDSFVQFMPQHSVMPGCGTYFSSNDYTADGCNRVFYSARLSEQQNVARGIFTARSADVDPPNRPDQGGIGASYLLRNLGTRVGVFVAQYDSRTSYTDVRKGTVLGPSGGSTYAVEYPEKKRLLALTSATRWLDSKLSWLNEISMTFGQPVQLNNSYLQQAFLTGTGPLGGDAKATAPNSLYRGYDRFRVSQVQSGLLKEFTNLLGAAKGYLGVEVSLKHTSGLPDARIRPYGRPETSDVCDTAAACATTDGFVTSNAWAYRVRAGLDYANVAGTKVRLRPSLQYGRDVKGWSYDYAFIQDRQTLRLAIDADFGAGLFGNLSYSMSRGGQFNTRKDRDYVLASMGYRF